MTDCEEHIRALERQLAEAKSTLKQIGKQLLDFEAIELNFLACEMEVLKEHPSVEFGGTVHGGLAAVMGRLSGMALRVNDMAAAAHSVAGPDADDKPTANTLN